MGPGDPVAFLGSRDKLLFLLVSRLEIQGSLGTLLYVYVTSKTWLSVSLLALIAYFYLAFALFSMQQSWLVILSNQDWEERGHTYCMVLQSAQYDFLLGSVSSQHNSMMMAAFHTDSWLCSFAHYFCLSCALGFGKSWAGYCLKPDLTYNTARCHVSAAQWHLWASAVGSELSQLPQPDVCVSNQSQNLHRSWLLMTCS